MILAPRWMPIPPARLSVYPACLRGFWHALETSGMPPLSIAPHHAELHVDLCTPLHRMVRKNHQVGTLRNGSRCTRQVKRVGMSRRVWWPKGGRKVTRHV